jgi:hypothetical protein
MRYLKAILTVSAIFALMAIGVCGVEVAVAVQEARQAARAISAQAKPILIRINATVTDLDRTVQIAGGAINEAREIERDNRSELAAVNRATLSTLQHVDGLVVNVDASQKQAASSIAQTSAELEPVMEQAELDLRELRPAIRQITPLLMESTDIAANLSNTTADVQHEIHKLVYPPPRKWWQRYFLDPLKTAAHLITIPLGHL